MFNTCLLALSTIQNIAASIEHSSTNFQLQTPVPIHPNIYCWSLTNKSWLFQSSDYG